MMNKWLAKSINLANNQSYYDHLEEIYPFKLLDIKYINPSYKNELEKHFNDKNNKELLKLMFKGMNKNKELNNSVELRAGVSDHRIGFFKAAYKNKENVSFDKICDLNEKTIGEICNRIYKNGFEKMIKNMIKPSKSSRTMGPDFTRWIDNGNLGLKSVDLNTFQTIKEDALLRGGDKLKRDFAIEKLGFNRNSNNKKGIDFVARINNKYIIGEAKILTTYGGAQTKNIKEAVSIFECNNNDIIKIVILDGVSYFKTNEVQYKTIIDYQNHNIMSALVLKEFLESLR